MDEMNSCHVLRLEWQMKKIAPPFPATDTTHRVLIRIAISAKHFFIL